MPTHTTKKRWWYRSQIRRNGTPKLSVMRHASGTKNADTHHQKKMVVAQRSAAFTQLWMPCRRNTYKRERERERERENGFIAVLKFDLMALAKRLAFLNETDNTIQYNPASEPQKQNRTVLYCTPRRFIIYFVCACSIVWFVPLRRSVPYSTVRTIDNSTVDIISTPTWVSVIQISPSYYYSCTVRSLSFSVLLYIWWIVVYHIDGS